LTSRIVCAITAHFAAAPESCNCLGIVKNHQSWGLIIDGIKAGRDHDNRIRGLAGRTVRPNGDAWELDQGTGKSKYVEVSITLQFDDETLANLPLGPGERERHMQIELACRFYAKGWLSLGQGARMAQLDRYAFGAELAERGIPRQYNTEDLEADLRYAGGQ
jgi:predicted HTH domain antitoxin